VLRQSGGDLGVALLVWLLGSVLALLGALTFGELGAMLPTRWQLRLRAGGIRPTPGFPPGLDAVPGDQHGRDRDARVAFANYLGELVSLTPATHNLAGSP